MLEMKPWYLVIEALLNVHKLDLSIILDLIKSVPDLCDEFGRNVRDLIAIRVLESLYARGIRNNETIVPPGSETQMDVSSFCQELLTLLLREGSMGDFRIDEKRMIDVDVNSCMHNCSLYHLKNVILKGSNPILKHLVDGSGLKAAHGNSGISDGIVEKRGVCQSMESKRKLSSFSSKDDEISEGNLCVEKLSPFKRVKNIIVAGNCEVVSPEPGGIFEESPKKLKRVLMCFPKNHRENIEENGFSEANDPISHSFENTVDHVISKDNDVRGHNLEISSDSGEYRDVRTDIALTKNNFLCSQGIDTQDSLGIQLNSCVKCHKGGNVVSCSSSSCPLVVHEECLGLATDFNRIGNFYCPFCAYQGAVSHYEEAKKKFLLSRTDLMTFHLFIADLEEEKLSKRSHRSKKHESSEIRNINEHIEPSENHDLSNEDIGNLIPPSKLDGQVGEPSKSSHRVKTPCGENEKSCSRDQDVVPGREIHNQMREQVLCQSDSDATCVPKCTDYNAEEGFNAESELSGASRYCVRLGKLGRQIKDPIAQLRKKLAWTNVEEQTLNTWEFNTIDPKDKWSTICKRSPRSK